MHLILELDSAHVKCDVLNGPNFLVNHRSQNIALYGVSAFHACEIL